jgi:hypothetical protein
MNDSKMEQLDQNSIQPQSIEADQTAESAQLGVPAQPLAAASRKKRWHFVSLVALIVLGVIPVIGYLLQSDTRQRLEGTGLAICAIAWGGLLIRHLILVLEEEDKIEEQQLGANRAIISPSNSNTAEQPGDNTAPPPEAGQNIK